ncbi:class I SAM-dependent DNA methyltransferase [Paracoccus indicus]|uniref:class I SAM-dependent DNA methyltransferase n=1 Tax=Paracoccus indicus TaxID=2079229 RepID=UPI001FEC92E4|nr:DNA methyltransferase [Paracoccus indicus]
MGNDEIIGLGSIGLSIKEFTERWKASGGSERANFQQFAIELTQLLNVPAPKPATADSQNDDYRFERPVTFIHTGAQSRGFIDLYRRGCFVMEAKQGTGQSTQTDEDQLSLISDLPKIQRQGHGVRGSRRWDDTMLRAKNQADGYARAVARSDGWPPFLIIADVGHVLEVYADFSGQGQGYTQFPDGARYRITLDDLNDPKTVERLRAIWTDPHSLDPAKISAEVTRGVANQLAALGRSFEGQGHRPEDVARFLMRCLFTMFAEDVHLIPPDSFKDLLIKLRGHPEHAAPALQSLWETMNTGGFSPTLTCDLKRFNGGLFKNASALPLSEVQLSLLITAAQHDWKEVEPAIFGTLLERALSPKDRHKLGAHYTPRAYVERLVKPTVIEPLRADWMAVQGAALTLVNQGKDKEALAEVEAFHRRLCEIRVLDPACGSGNFLYVALELMKRLEGEVTALMADLGQDQVALSLAGHTVDPHQFLGIELNPWAAAVAELVLWIGYLQWHFRTHGKASPAEPVLRDFKNIENRDAVLTWEAMTPRLDEAGQPVTRWDGETMITSHITGQPIPDPDARVRVPDYSNPKSAKWPEADFIVGNPPFIGASRMRDALGDGYAEALWKAYPKMPHSADFVMFWWEKAALATRAYRSATDKAKAKGCRRMGFITTNSLRQTFNRRVLEPHLNDRKTPLSLLFAVPDHPWVDAGDGAAVRIAMTVAGPASEPGRLLTIINETRGEQEAEGRQVSFSIEKGKVFANLRLGADVAGAVPLKANEGLAHMGVKLHGTGFLVSNEQAKTLALDAPEKLDDHLKRFFNGRDLAQSSRGVFVIDLFGLSLQDAQAHFPQLVQHLMDHVKPDRAAKAGNSKDAAKYAEEWWLFGKTRPELRTAVAKLRRHIGTTRTAKHRIFQMLPDDCLTESEIINITVDDQSIMATLSSRYHITWSLAAGGTLEDRPRYNHSVCFLPFPFPTPTDAQTATLRSLGEQLDAHRKDRLAAHPKLTLTGLYNLLEKVRAGTKIEGKDKEVYDQGLVGILRDLHDRIDVAVAEAYGWPADLSDDDILHRLVDLNRERAAEEATGLIRWLRPDYQNPDGKAVATKAGQGAMDLGIAAATTKTPWPKTLPDQLSAVQRKLGELGIATPEQIARQFARGRATTVQPLLESLTALGQARMFEDGRFAA